MKERHFINYALLGSLEEAALWGTRSETGKRVFGHVLLASRVAYFAGKALQENAIEGYENINLGCAVQAALLHDFSKMVWGDAEDTQRAKDWTQNQLKQYRISETVCRLVVNHDFPREMPDDPLVKLVMLGDFMAGQKIMTVEERLEDIKTRWVVSDVATDIIENMANEIFGALETTDHQFIEEHKLNSPIAQTRWEKFLSKTMARDKTSRAKHLVSLLVKEGKK